MKNKDKAWNKKHTISKREKNKDKKAWFKENADRLDTYGSDVIDEDGKSEFHNMQVNYDLFNNKLNLDDLKHVCMPFGISIDKNPVKMTNKDISSGKIKAVLGMEMKRPFPYKVAALNVEATTRREQAEFGKMKEYVVESIMGPIREQVQMQHQQQMEGQELSEDQKQQIQQQIQEEIQAKTPEEVKKYMSRDYQDPAEAMSHQLLTYLTKKCDLKRKFNGAFKHACLAAKEVMYVGVVNKEPNALVVNNLRFRHDRSPDLTFVEEGSWATYEHRMSPSDVVNFFSGELDEDEVNRIYDAGKYFGGESEDGYIDLFKIDERSNNYDNNEHITVLHTVWRAPRKLGFLTYIGQDGTEQMQIVDESYKLNKDFGDISIEWEYPSEVYETWKIKISDPIYKRMRAIPGQFKDLDNLYYSPLPYYGVLFDNMNSTPVSPMDRLKLFQYLFNTIKYRQEALMASDKGKRILMNINAVPDSMGMKKWQQTAETTPYMWYDPNEEGTGYSDVNTLVKVLDLSLASDIRAYDDLAESVRIQAGRSIGVTDSVEGQVAPGEAVRNNQQNLVQSSYLLEPYFELHNIFKKNVLTALLELSKVTYSKEKPLKLVYVLDDMSTEVLNLDMGLLDNTTLGIFIADSGEVQKIKDTIEQLAHAAMQNQRVELSDVISVMRQDSIIEAQETMKLAEDDKRAAEMAQQREQQKFQSEEGEKMRAREKEKHEEEKELITLKEEERRKTEVIKSGIMGASFNPDADKDGDGVNDFIEIARDGVNADIARSKAQLERDEFEHKRNVDTKTLAQTDKKLEIEDKKVTQANKNKTSQK